MLAARGVTKRHGLREVLRGVDLDLVPGRVLALHGPNGAGKSTLLRILALLQRPSSGQLLWQDRPLRGREAEVRRCLGVVAHQTFLYDYLTAAENLRFYAGLYGVTDAGRRVDELLAAVGLEPYARDPVGTFSRGMQQRLAIARALVQRPRVLLLDEPFTGLDRDGQALLVELLGRFRAEGGTCLLVSHDFEASAQVADAFAVLHRGSVACHVPVRGRGAAELAALYEEAVGAPAAAAAPWEEA